MSESFSSRLERMFDGAAFTRTAEASPPAERASMRSDKVVSKPALLPIPVEEVAAHEQLVQHFRNELHDEFADATFSRRAIINSLAVDFAQLHRLDQMIVTRNQPNLSSDDVRDLKELTGAKELDGRVDKALIALNESRLPNCTAEDGERLAESMASWLTSLEANVNQPAEDRIPWSKLTKLEKAELAQYKRLLLMAASARPLLRDTDRLTAILCGRGQLDELERRGLVVVLEDMRINVRRSLRGLEHFEQRMKKQRATHLQRQADNPEEMLVLEQMKEKLLARVKGQLKAMSE